MLFGKTSVNTNPIFLFYIKRLPWFLWSLFRRQTYFDSDFDTFLLFTQRKISNKSMFEVILFQYQRIIFEYNVLSISSQTWKSHKIYSNNVFEQNNIIVFVFREFSSSDRILIIHKILISSGLSKLITQQIIETTYPLHDGPCGSTSHSYSNERQVRINVYN